MGASPNVRTHSTEKEPAGPEKISPKAWHKKASHAFVTLLKKNQLRRVFTIKRDELPNMFGALTPWSGKPEDMLGVVVKGDIMHFYQLLNYLDKGGQQGPVPASDDVSKINLVRDSPEGRYQDVIDAIRRLLGAKQHKTLLNLDSEGLEDLLPTNEETWKTIVTTSADDGSILVHELTSQVQEVQPTYA